MVWVGGGRSGQKCWGQLLQASLVPGLFKGLLLLVLTWSGSLDIWQKYPSRVIIVIAQIVLEFTQTICPNVILEKIIIDLEDEVVNLLEKEKVNLETIESLKSKSFESSEKVSSESENQSENDCLVVEKERDKEENQKVIAPGMFKLNVSGWLQIISRKSLPGSFLRSRLHWKRIRLKRDKSEQKRTKPDKNRKRVEAGKSLKQLQ
nr:hypothetical protein [Tanacetum cinerariifolium]